MTGTKTTERAANRAEKVVARPLTPLQDKSDGDNNIIVPRTLLPIGES